MMILLTYPRNFMIQFNLIVIHIQISLVVPVTFFIAVLKVNFLIEHHTLLLVMSLYPPLIWNNLPAFYFFSSRL